MGTIIDKITEFIKEMLQGWVLDNLETMFTDVNTKVGSIAGEVGQTPSSWNAGIFSMVAVMLPFFFLAMYEKDGFPAEKILYFMIRQKILTPGIRPYKSENIYRQLEEREKIEKEVRYLEEKAAGKTTG